MLTNATFGEGVLSRSEIDADSFLDRRAEFVATLILNGPSTDDDGWFCLLLDGEEA